MVNVILLLKLKVCPSILIFIIQRPDYKITDYCHYPVYLNIDWLLSYPSLFLKEVFQNQLFHNLPAHLLLTGWIFSQIAESS